MLADSFNYSMNTGGMAKELRRGSSFRKHLLHFIATHLPRWRDEHPGMDTAETSLTAGLSAYLTSRARLSDGWDFIQFRSEVPDESAKGRKIDLAPAPCAAVIWIEERRHSDQDIIFPIECKRLPTPRGKTRDEREYVISRYNSTGGIQRFKAGHHGSLHNFAAMIAYVQKDSVATWHSRVNNWIDELTNAQTTGWNSSDRILAMPQIPKLDVSLFRSTHSRTKGQPKIELSHLWLRM